MGAPEGQFGEWLHDAYVCVLASRPAKASPTLDSLAVGFESILGKLLGEIVSILESAWNVEYLELCIAEHFHLQIASWLYDQTILLGSCKVAHYCFYCIGVGLLGGRGEAADG